MLRRSVSTGSPAKGLSALTAGSNHLFAHMPAIKGIRRSRDSFLLRVKLREG